MRILTVWMSSHSLQNQRPSADTISRVLPLHLWNCYLYLHHALYTFPNVLSTTFSCVLVCPAETKYPQRLIFSILLVMHNYVYYIYTYVSVCIIYRPSRKLLRTLSSSGMKHCVVWYVWRRCSVISFMSYEVRWWRCKIALKHWYTATWLNGVTSQNTATYVYTSYNTWSAKTKMSDISCEQQIIEDTMHPGNKEECLHYASVKRR
jgi:hypothetical protein